MPQIAFVAKLSAATTPGTRTIAYSYDGLLRLIGAIERPGNVYEYASDTAGNRISAQVNGAATTTLSYNAANQVTNAGSSYDLAGNLLTDGTATYTYDALSRAKTVAVGAQTRAYTYNGDGTLVVQVAGTTRISLTEDLAAPLSQILQSRTGSAAPLTYLYGRERLVLPNGAGRVWPLADGLGSVRRTIDDSGAVVATSSYDPWGNVESGNVPSFRFTGELQDPAVGLVNLRARWYSTAKGAFTSRDPFEGDPTQPYSQHPYQYVGNSPINGVDPTGRWWWGPGQALFTASWQRANSANVHVRIQATAMVGREDEIHAEYTIPSTPLPVDLLDSVTGEIWEIKPWDELDQARISLQARLRAIRVAKRAELLQGTDPFGQDYNWNFAPARWTEGQRFPTFDFYLGTDDSGWWDIYATQVEPGIILWWKYRRGQKVQVPRPILLPRNVAWSEKNTRPGWQPVPVPAGTQPAFAATTPNGCTAEDVAAGAAAAGGLVFLWWLAKWLAPVCGPGAPACALVF